MHVLSPLGLPHLLAHVISCIPPSRPRTRPLMSVLGRTNAPCVNVWMRGPVRSRTLSPEESGRRKALARGQLIVGEGPPGVSSRPLVSWSPATCVGGDAAHRK